MQNERKSISPGDVDYYRRENVIKIAIAKGVALHTQEVLLFILCSCLLHE